jgi:tetratricopeptide (TPR) repeat protein
MSADNTTLLIDHLDHTLQGGSLPEATALLNTDPQAQETWQYLNIAVDAIQHEALHQQVAAVRKEMQPKRPIIRRLGSVIGVAAVLAGLLGLFVFYKFITVTPESVYENQFVAYELRTTRSNAETDALRVAYQQQDWQQVLNTYHLLPVKSGEAHFLAAIAAMQLKKFDLAIPKLEIIRSNYNNFVDEADYYLALAWLATGETHRAIPLLETIRSDKNHTYYEKARAISALDLRILSLK